MAIPYKPEVDPHESCSEVARDLPKAEPNTDPKPAPTPRRRKRWPWIFLGLVVMFVIALVWLNGPGLRFIAPRVAVHFLEKAGMKGNFKVGGSLTGGLSFSDLTIESDGALEKVTVGKIIPEYELAGLVKGKLKGLTVDGVHVDLRLGMDEKDEEKPPLDLKKLVETIRSVRGQVIPVRVDLKNISLTAKRDGKTEFQLDPTTLHHAKGSDEFTLALGAITDPSGKVWEGRDSRIVWQTDKLSIDRIDPLPDVGLRDLVVKLPAGGEPSAEVQLNLDDAVFMISTTPGFAAARIDLREGGLQIDETVKRFGIEIPAQAKLTSLAVEASGIMPDPKAATGTVKLALENIVSGDWTLPTLNLEAGLTADQGTVAARGTALGSGFSLDAEVPMTRQETRFSLGTATGNFKVEDIPAVVKDLAPRFEAIDPQASVPASDLSGKFVVPFTGFKPESANAEALLRPQDPAVASAVSVKGRWAPGQPVTADVVIDGLKAAATYQIEAASYRGTLELDGFTNARIDAWLAIAKVKAGGRGEVTGRWNGAGDLNAGKHRGEASLSQVLWSREGMEPIEAAANLKYDWPAGFEATGVNAKTGDQKVALEATLANGLLELKNLVWTQGETELADGTASLPVPEDFSKWRDTIAKDERPVAVAINSRVLSLGLLKQWVPQMEKVDPAATGQLGINISGTYADPVVDAKLEARDLRSPQQPSLPPADLVLSLVAKEGRIKLDGSVTAPQYPPAILKAEMPFRPADWANDPGLLKEESVSAVVDLPRLDVSRFTPLVTPAKQVKGILTGNLAVTGKLSKPEIRGGIRLTSAALQFKDPTFPPVDAVSADVDFALDRVVLKSLRASVSGGTLGGDGTLAITDGKPGEINFSLRGDHLPVMRNDFLIMRANLNLRLLGTWESATLGGTVSVVDSIFYRDMEILPIGKPFTGPSAAALPKIDPPAKKSQSIPEPFANWKLDVTARTDQPFLIRGNLATGDVTGSVKIGGTVSEPAPDGQFKIHNLKASLPFSTLSVKEGLVRFAPASGFDPILEIRGTAEPRPYQVYVYAYGRASDPQLVLTSNPPLPENEIMTLLATGTTTSGLEDPQAASSRALQLLAEELRRGRFRFGKQLRPVLALLDRVDFSLADADPYSSESFSTATISLTDRWFVSAGLSDNGDTRFMTLWRLSFR